MAVSIRLAPNIEQRLNQLAEQTPVVLPLHPRTVAALKRLPGVTLNPSVLVIEPVGFLEMTWLLAKCSLVLTDSGGVQEEAPSLGKPVLVIRDTTERPAAVDAGTVKLVGTDQQKIIDEATILLDSQDAYSAMARAINPYGDGKAASHLVSLHHPPAAAPQAQAPARPRAL